MADFGSASKALPDPDRVVADPLRFKRKLRIGTQAFAVLRARDGLASLMGTVGVAATGAGVAQSSLVATTFFASTASSGVLAWLGIGAVAATPVGWVAATALASSVAYYGVTRLMGRGADQFVDTIPKFINTPIDLLGAQLLDLIGALALHVAAIDGSIDPRERAEIVDHFVADWGFDPAYVDRALALITAEIDMVRVVDLAQNITFFARANPDCNATAMQAELMQFLRDVIAADGVIDERETLAIAAIERVFSEQQQLPLDDIAQHLKGAIATAGTVGGEAVEAATTTAKAARDLLAAHWNKTLGYDECQTHLKKPISATLAPHSTPPKSPS